MNPNYVVPAGTQFRSGTKGVKKPIFMLDPITGVYVMFVSQPLRCKEPRHTGIWLELMAYYFSMALIYLRMLLLLVCQIIIHLLVVIDTSIHVKPCNYLSQSP